MAVTYVFSLPSISCVNCVIPIERALRALTSINIDSLSVDIVEKKLTLVVAESPDDSINVRQLLCQELDSLGVEYIEIKNIEVNNKLIKKNLFLHWALGSLGIVSGITILALTMLFSMPFLGSILIAAISVPLTLMLGASSYKEATVNLFKTRALTMDILFLLSTITVISISLAAFFVPGLPMMFDAGLLIFGFRHIGYAIEASIQQAIGLGKNFKDRLPREVRVAHDLTFEKKLLENIKIGEVILVQPGDIIPLDGIFEDDDGFIFDTIRSGSNLHRSPVKGEVALAGMTVAEGSKPMRILVRADVNKSYLARLDEKIARAIHEKAPLETATNKILQYFIPGVITFSLISALIISHYFSIGVAIQCAAAVLVSACPCTLGFITPLALKIGMNKAAEHGVSFESAKKLEEARDIDSVVFDLNGTITEGMPSVRRYEVLKDSNLSKEDFFAYFSLLEEKSSHPIGRAIRAFTNGQVKTESNLWQFNLVTQSSNSGLSAIINNQLFTLGNQNMMDAAGIDTTLISDNIKSEDEDSIIYLACEKRVVGYLVLQDKIRPNAIATINALKAMGKNIYLCTGADEDTAKRYGSKLGISHSNIQAGCPGSAISSEIMDKETFIKNLIQKGKRVAFVGDGPNDALAIAASNFGIAIKSIGGDEITENQAGAIINSGTLMPVANVFAVASETVSNIKQNLIFSLSYNIGAMLFSSGLLLSAGLMLNPSIGVLLMIIQTSMILGNAYNFKQRKLEHLQYELDVEEPLQGSYQLVAENMPLHEVKMKVAASITTPENQNSYSLTSPHFYRRKLPRYDGGIYAKLMPSRDLSVNIALK